MTAGQTPSVGGARSNVTEAEARDIALMLRVAVG